MTGQVNGDSRIKSLQATKGETIGDPFLSSQGPPGLVMRNGSCFANSQINKSENFNLFQLFSHETLGPFVGAPNLVFRVLKGRHL